MNDGRSRTIRVGGLARVEGEGGLLIKTKGQRVTQVQLDIYEPPRFFEAFLRGRHFAEVPDITARICGICPVAYQMSSVHAMEQALGITPDPQVRALRRLIYCGEWIESHVLHVAMLHAPDFLGYESGVHMAKDHPELVRLSLELKKVGNDLVRIVGGREIHPVNVRVGGFYRLPTRPELAAIRERLLRARDGAGELLRAVSAFDFPDFEQDYEFVALRHPVEYPFNDGRLVSNRGLDIAITDFERCFREEHVPHSNALHAVNKERGAYHVGPLARYNLNFDRLPAMAREAAAAAGLGPECRNPFKSILVRGVETLYACDEAVRLIDAYEPPARAFVDAPPRAGVGHGCSEAPRGLLYHRYEIGDDGLVVEARIVPPTAQNLKTIENDLWRLVPQYLDLPTADLTWKCEQAVRNYDPCISCATHFLRLTLERE
jgi:coenzyme F420-reducing hydrogenase alpha subunit